MQKIWLSEYATERGVGAVAATEQGIFQVWLPGDEWPTAHSGASELSLKAAEQLARYFHSTLQQFDLQVDISGLTAFRQHVLQLSMQIPYGTTTTYADLAAQAGTPKAARAVGGAMASNPVPVIIPCHRVISTSGALTGYSGSGGILMKKFLLSLEGVDFMGLKNV